MKNLLTIFFTFYCIINISCGKSFVSENGANKPDTIFVAQWNLENLFDLYDDPNKIDEEFLPAGKKEWNKERLDKKFYNLAKVIKSMNNNNGPDILSVCEVEHKSLLDSLTNNFLKQRNYKTALLESPDERGIDNGLIYDANKFKLISVLGDTINLTKDKTRLILNVNLLFNEDTLRIFVNHWPSRRGGVPESEPKRIAAALTLKNHLNKISYEKSKILIMGDFNDEPNNNSVLKTLNAQPFFCDKKDSEKISLKEFQLFNLSYPDYKKGFGSYKYRDDWNMLDQIIVSSNLINGNLFYSCGSFEIYKPDFLVTHSGKYEGTPFPTYGGSRYLGGYSDHFPLTAKFIFKGDN